MHGKDPNDLDAIVADGLSELRQNFWTASRLPI
jgi:hypothetical protein